jgi:hypothetical protein
MMGLSRIGALALLLACDGPAGDTEGSGSSGEETGGGCPLLCTKTTPCTPECYPDPCGTVGDWCDATLGDLQCGLRMACVPLPDDGVAWGVCVAPCSESNECTRGKCDYEVGACYGDASELVAVLACE